MRWPIQLRLFKQSLLCLLLFSACTKEGPQGPAGPQGPQGQQGTQGTQGVAPTPTIVGYWTGAWAGDNTSYPKNVYNFLFRNNGTVRIYETADTSAGAYEGTYTIHGDTVSATYATSLLFAGVVDADFTFMQGYWGYNINPNVGLFFAAK